MFDMRTLSHFAVVSIFTRHFCSECHRLCVLRIIRTRWRTALIFMSKRRIIYQRRGKKKRRRDDIRCQETTDEDDGAEAAAMRCAADDLALKTNTYIQSYPRTELKTRHPIITWTCCPSLTLHGADVSCPTLNFRGSGPTYLLHLPPRSY